MRTKTVLVSGGILALFFFAACAGAPRARLTAWKNNELTVCCPSEHRCNAKDWARAAAPYCSGSAKLVGGQMRERTSGYQANVVDKGKRLELQPETEALSCRIFQCQGEVIPPAE